MLQTAGIVRLFQCFLTRGRLLLLLIMSRALYQPFPMAGRARAQVWRYSPEHRRPRHFHIEPELNVVARGSATFAVEGEEITARAGDLLWWMPGQDHELTAASTDLDLFVIGLTPELSERVIGANTAVTYSGPTRMRLSATAARGLLERCEGLLGCAGAPTIEQRIGDVWREAHVYRGAHADMHALTRRALRLLLARGDVRRSEVPGSGAHPAEVSRHFRHDVRMSFAAYRNRLRLLRFIEEVDRRSQDFLSAALAAGFGSYSQCHRSFRATLGCSPREFFAGPVRRAMTDAFAPTPPVLDARGESHARSNRVG
jgi:AraC-like DNA-binding protein/mannose-6-phosphate isomerase-like protein (cupin superfamily)